MLLTSTVGRCYCAFCKSERKFFKRKRLAAVHIFQAIMAAVLVMYLMWWGFDARVFILIPLFVVIAEFIVIMRWRIYIVCPHCGFDPVLYAKSPEKAAQLVSEYMRRQEDNPHYSLLPNPRRNLFHRRVPMVPKKEESITSG